MRLFFGAIRRHRGRLFALTSCLFALISVCSLLQSIIVPQLQRLRFRAGLSWYDLGLYGFYPTRSYVSFEYASPATEIARWDPRCTAGYTFVAPRGDSIVQPGPMILDEYGELVWMMPLPGITQDFRVQEYLGEQYLTYWNGGQVEGHGEGAWYMLDSSYVQRFRVQPVGEFAGGDLHDFQITENGTALVTIYDTKAADLSSIGGPEFGYIYDGIFQEIDIATGELVFEWRMSEHFALNSSYEPLNGKGVDRDRAYDLFHLNSVEKDHLGNYIISARHSRAIVNIDSQTGEVLWTLGGKLNEFVDASDGRATSFAWQHDARWHGNHTLTLFDNRARGEAGDGLQSRGMLLDLDVPSRVATLQQEYLHPEAVKATSQGNLQMLDNSGNVFIGWGHCAAYTEFLADGTALCDTHFAASAWFDFGRVGSYRAVKGDWIGEPATLPAAVAEEDCVYVSWNGATEVASWRLEVWDGVDLDEMHFDPATTTTTTTDNEEYDSDHVIVVIKEAFETEIRLPSTITRTTFFRVVALDAQGQVLGTTQTLHKKARSTLADLLVMAATSRWDLLVSLTMLACSVLLLGVYWAARVVARKRNGEYQRISAGSSQVLDGEYDEDEDGLEEAGWW
ncbi:UPF0182 protein [Talaromyces islandicus]|uniref:UPF0182 protein n=1 Tax=Talaromyces islandicus TaxID=28573 RepID=A0A0U1M4L1_TALIS|nr:UPF0182 protein [Talaromyces islandicus]